jgi:hypothetical protein
MLFSTLRVVLQQNGKNTPNIKRLIINGFAKSPDFAIFSSGGRLFHFKGSICVKKLCRYLHFCPKVPLLDRNETK